MWLDFTWSGLHLLELAAKSASSLAAAEKNAAKRHIYGRNHGYIFNVEEGIVCMSIRQISCMRPDSIGSYIQQQNAMEHYRNDLIMFALLTD